MPDSETIAAAITDEHQHQPVKVISLPVMTWVTKCANNVLMQTGSQPVVLAMHPATAKLLQQSLFEVNLVAMDLEQVVLGGARVHVTYAVPRYCLSIELADKRVAVVDHNGDILVCL